MASATLTSKGQITIPAAIRERLGLRTGDRVDFVTQPDGTVRMFTKRIPFEDLRGIVRSPLGRPATLKEIDEGIAQAVRERLERAAGGPTR